MEVGGKMGKGWCDVDLQRTSFYFWGFLRLCKFRWKSIKKCDRGSAHRRIDRHWNWQMQTVLLPRCMECRRGLAMRIMSVRRLSVCQTR